MNHSNGLPETETSNKHIQQEATGVEHRGFNVNNIAGDSEKNTVDTHHLLLLAPECQQKWININNRTVFDNPTQAVYTLMDWYNTSITDKEGKDISYIGSPNQTDELAKAIQDFCQTKEITLTSDTKSFAELCSCKKLKHNPILIVAVANTHSHEKNVRGMPYYQQLPYLCCSSRRSRTL